MKNSCLLFIFFIISFHLSGFTSYDVTIEGTLITTDEVSPAGIEVILTLDDSTSIDGLELVTTTDNNGHFVFEFVSNSEVGCGYIFVPNCDANTYPMEVCFSIDQPKIEMELPFCNYVSPCVNEIYIDQIALPTGQIELILALPEDRDYEILWSTGETSLSIIANPGEEYCVIISTPDCESRKCIIAGYNEDCIIRIHQEWSIEGMAILHVESRGNQPILEYVWSNGSTEPFIEVRDSGTYCVEVVFANGCSTADCIDVQPWIEDCLAFIYEDINNNGKRFLGVETIWGHEIKEYIWSTGATTPTIIPELSDKYAVTITTTSGCTTSSEYYFTSDQDCEVIIHKEEWWEPALEGVYLFAEAKPSNGIHYEWSTGETEPFVIAKETGEYCVTITNDAGCEASHCVKVDLDSIWNGHCHVYIEETADDNGQIALQAGGWYSPNSAITWSTGESGREIYPTEFGEYCVTVTNDNGCYAEACYFYNSNGNCRVEVLEANYEGVKFLYPHPYGVPPFQYKWSEGSEDDYITVRESGEYCVTMTDATGCQSRWCGYVRVNDNEFCEAYISVERDEDGNKYYKVHGLGEAPFEYIWDHDMLEGELVMINEPGVYCVDVIDATGCHTSTCIEVPPIDSCYVDIGYTYGFAGDTILYIRPHSNLEYKVTWDNGSTTPEIAWDGNPICAKIEFANGCTTSACFDDIPNNGRFYISGFVSDPVLDYLPSLDKVTFYHMNSDSVITKARAEVKITENSFVAELYESGSYLIRADVEGYLPTYYKSAIHWQDAIPVGVDDATVALVYEIFMIREDEENGIGKVSGSVLAGENVRINLGVREGDPFGGAEIILTDLDGHGLQAVYTDSNGNFILDGIPFGTYYVVLEIPGLPQQRIEVTISEEQPVVEGIFFESGAEAIDHTLNTKDLNNFSFSVYPNPANHYIEISLNERTSLDQSLVFIMDISGKIISADQVAFDHQGKYRMDISHLNSGSMFILMVQNRNETGLKKFFIAR